MELSSDSFRKVHVFQVVSLVSPLLGRGRLVVRGDFPSHSILCLNERGERLSALSTRHTLDGLSASVNVLGTFVVAQDTVPPQLSAWAARKRGICVFGCRISCRVSLLIGWRLTDIGVCLVMILNFAYWRAACRNLYSGKGRTGLWFVWRIASVMSLPWRKWSYFSIIV